MTRTQEDNLLRLYRRLVRKIGHFPGNYLADDGSSDILAAAWRLSGDSLALDTLRREVVALDLRVTWQEYCEAREYYACLSIGDLQASHKLAQENGWCSWADNGFEYWLVCEVAESKFCKAYDC